MTTAHLDDEAISAVLDGEATPDEVAHVEECDACRGRLRSFAAVADAVRAPVPPPDPRARAAALRAALGAAPARRRRSWRPALAVAALAVAALAAVPLIVRSGGKAADDETASKAGPAATAEAASPAVDLGPLDEAAVRAAVGAALSPAAPVEGSGGGTPAGGSAAGDDSTRAGPEPPSSPPALFAAGDALERCAGALREAGNAGPLAYRATGTWQGEPVVVLAIRHPRDVSAYVMAASDCRIVHFVRFRPSP